MGKGTILYTQLKIGWRVAECCSAYNGNLFRDIIGLASFSIFWADVIEQMLDISAYPFVKAI